MKILMFTNTYRPHVGGVARSIRLFSEALTRQGHAVRIVAPRFADLSEDDRNVLRVQAVTDFNGSGFSLPLPTLVKVMRQARDFKPDILHAHHSFLLGNTALRCAVRLGVPLAYTYHTLYEQYTHYFPGDSAFLRRFVVFLSALYCAYCDAVLVPSASMAQMLGARGVRSRVHVLPTGVDLDFFSGGNGMGIRRQAKIPANAFVIGHVGRLALEKNLEFLSHALADCLQRRPAAHVLVVGLGPMETRIRKIFGDYGVDRRLHLLGLLTRSALADAYHAMDVFAFSSHSETQGLVLTEAMAAGRPVVALDGPGVRDVVQDRLNGRLIMGEDKEAFVQAILWMESLPAKQRYAMNHAVAQTAEDFCLQNSTRNLLDLYKFTIEAYAVQMRQAHRPRPGLIGVQQRIAGIYLTAAMQAMATTFWVKKGGRVLSLFTSHR